VLLIRSLVTIDGVGRALDPHFDIAAQLHPFVRSLTVRRFHPWRLMAQAARTGEDMQRIATLLPDVLGQSLESIKRGELTVRFDLQHFDHLVHRLTRAGNTLAVGILAAGLLVGSSVVLKAGAATLGYIGLGLAALLGIWLGWNILRG
jgi:ubiquinone biosynthesis protein